MAVKISIIVPIYNVEKYLEKCLNSLVHQTLQGIEIIVVDDASPDSSILIARKYEKEFPELVFVIQSEKNLKQGGAKNIGLKHAKGEFIGFVDGDDWVDITMFEKLYLKFLETKSDVIDCDYFQVFETTNKTEMLISNKSDQLGELDIFKKKKLILNSGRMVTKIYKKELFINNNLYFSENLFYEDNEIQPLLMVLSKKLAKVKEPLYYYRIRKGSTTKKNNSYQHFDRLDTSVNMLMRFKDKGLYATYKDEIEFKFLKSYYIRAISLCLNDFDKPEMKYLNRIRNYMRINFPEYRSNPYFKSKLSSWQKLISLATDLDPRLSVVMNFARKKLR